ncbi:MAG: hypothetical protein KF833_21475 [Verrucomicrobiae bacterium]|nr:hypothetical protein [Verrucomicrobiae bacterium]
MESWIPTLKQHWGDRADIVGVAALRGIPRMFQSRIAESVRRTQPRPVLLDFDGTVTGQLEYTRRQANVYIVDAQGRLRAHVSGPPTAEAIGVLHAAFNAASAVPAPSTDSTPASPAPPQAPPR